MESIAHNLVFSRLKSRLIARLVCGVRSELTVISDPMSNDLHVLQTIGFFLIAFW